VAHVLCSRTSPVLICCAPAATEWRDIMIEAAKGAIILAILERLFLTRPLYWLEVRTHAACMPSGRI
jgi:hypothetical protein